jgi:hypothetical protein
MPANRAVRILLLVSIIAIIAPAVFGQQVGSISGKVTGVDGSSLPGVTVEARSNVLPQPRVTVSSANGDYRLPLLPPGRYTVQFSLAGMETRSRDVSVLLDQNATLNVSLGLQGVSESITVTAESSLVDPDSTSLKSAVAEQDIEDLPIGQEYRNLLKLAPAVQYSEDEIRGPSSGGSGQDNTYLFDGVNVTLPLFGTLSAEPSTHDIQQISFVKGGAKAVDFVRSAGFTVDTVSKSGTNEFKGEVGYKFQTEAMRGDVTGVSVSPFDQYKSWSTVNVGGPLWRDRLFGYGSYYRPTIERTNRTNPYGELPDYDSQRNEYFGKLTFTPTQSILLNGSYRTSDRKIDFASIGVTSAPSTALNEESTQDIAIIEGSWVINSRSYLSVKYTDYLNETNSTPVNIVSAVPTTVVGTRIDLGQLDKLGLFVVPTTATGQDAYNAFVQPLIDRYGFIRDGARVGGGEAGYGSQINDQDFFRKSAQIGFDFTLGSTVAHDLHGGYQQFEDGEDLSRISNGWGVLRAPRGVTFGGQPVFFQAEFTRSPTGGAGRDINIHSEFQSESIELNDTIRYGNWAFNAGVLVSNDTLYGQGLREDSSALSGYVSAPGNKYKMYEVPWSRQIQPRFGATWAYNGLDNVYASYARYIPAANSLPRAASWDRNTLGLTTRVHFDATGAIIGSEQVASSSGKLFVEDLDPRHTDEILIGTSQQITSGWSARAYGRYRYSTNFWEDTNNNALVQWAPDGYRKELYIPDLSARIAQIGSGSSYVIAELEGAFTKHFEVTTESDWRSGPWFARGSYTWSHYYGNFDQDNTSLTNDVAIFMGSSNIADGPGRQIWDHKYGDLHGDRRHLLKAFGSYDLPWNGTAGLIGLYQSGQPWEAWSFVPYRTLPGFGTSTSDTDRYLENSGSRKGEAHYQFDFSYTQNIPVSKLNFQIQLDAINLLDRQTGYNFQPSVQAANFGLARDFYDPRRFELALRLSF